MYLYLQYPRMRASCTRALTFSAPSAHPCPKLAPTCAVTRTMDAGPLFYLLFPTNQTRLQAGRHTVRVCVATGGFTLDEITVDQQASGTCNKDGT